MQGHIKRTDVFLYIGNQAANFLLGELLIIAENVCGAEFNLQITTECGARGSGSRSGKIFEANLICI